MTIKDNAVPAAMRQAMQNLRRSTAENLRTFNDAVPFADRLRRSEMKRFTVDLLWATKRAPQRRWPTLFGKIGNAYSWIKRVKGAARLP